jgi:hypothetical protein
MYLAIVLQNERDLSAWPEPKPPAHLDRDGDPPIARDGRDDFSHGVPQ